MKKLNISLVLAIGILLMSCSDHGSPKIEFQDENENKIYDNNLVVKLESTDRYTFVLKCIVTDEHLINVKFFKTYKNSRTQLFDGELRYYIQATADGMTDANFRILNELYEVGDVINFEVYAEDKRGNIAVEEKIINVE